MHWYMQNQYFNAIVKSLWKYRWKLIHLDVLKHLLQSVLDDAYTDQKLYKLIYGLKNRSFLSSLKKDLYFVKSPDLEYTQEQFLEMFYWQAVKQHCKKYLESDRYVWGIKALELNISSFDPPEELLIVNSYKQSSEILMFDKKIMFKYYQMNDQKMFKIFSKFTHKVHIGEAVFPIANLELALLESFYNTPLLSSWYVEELAKKILRKHKKNLDFRVREKIILHGKHHSSINRLYKIAQIVDPVLADEIKRIIKRYSYFVNV